MQCARRTRSWRRFIERFKKNVHIENRSLNYLNEDNGYKEIEDASWLELVERGRIRADKVAEYLLGKYDEITLKIEPSLNLMVADILKLHQNNPTRYDWHTNNE